MIGQYFYLVQEKESKAPNAAQTQIYNSRLFFRNDPSDESFQSVLKDASVINTPRKADQELESIWTHFQIALASEFCSRELKF